jgi:hypothetical protein
MPGPPHFCSCPIYSEQWPVFGSTGDCSPTPMLLSALNSKKSRWIRTNSKVLSIQYSWLTKVCVDCIRCYNQLPNGKKYVYLGSHPAVSPAEPRLRQMALVFCCCRCVPVGHKLGQSAAFTRLKSWLTLKKIYCRLRYSAHDSLGSWPKAHDSLQGWHHHSLVIPDASGAISRLFSLGHFQCLIGPLPLILGCLDHALHCLPAGNGLG